MMNPNKTQHLYAEPTAQELLREFTDRQVESNSIEASFPPGVEGARYEALPCAGRQDLRHLDCLTIDCADTKDMDDAVSLTCTSGGYILGVHIADVSAYVAPGSRLDAVAVDRGTSVYLPDRTIPMLPKVLSNGLCSLNPGEDRLAISLLVELDAKGEVLGYGLSKSVVRSRVKGEYQEVNQMLAGKPRQRVAKKYRGFESALADMSRLAEALRARRVEQGASTRQNYAPVFSFDGGQIAVADRKQGKAGRMIEEFMVLANRIVADFCEEHDIPALFRRQNKSGAKAKYGSVGGRHAELALERYTHFTSPIRRVADLKTHQMLSLYLAGASAEELHGAYDGELLAVSEVANRRAERAANVERACERFCIWAYFSAHSGRVFHGRVVGRDKYGRPLILVNGTATRVVSASKRPLSLGQKVEFKVAAGQERRTACAYSVKTSQRAA